MSEFKEVRCDHCGRTFAALSDGSPVVACMCGKTIMVHWVNSLGTSVPTATDYGTIRTHTPPRVDDDATVKAEPFSVSNGESFKIVGTYESGGNAAAPPDFIKVCSPEDPRAGPSVTTYYDFARLGSSVSDALRAYNTIVASVRAGLRDAGLTDEATIDRLTAAIVERLGDGA